MGADCRLGQQIHFASNGSRDFALQRNDGQQALAFRKLYEQVNVALGCGLAFGHRSKQSDLRHILMSTDVNQLSCIKRISNVCHDPSPTSNYMPAPEIHLESLN